MDWNDVGHWLKENAGTGAALIGSLLTGNAPAAVAAGVGLVASATGADQPDAVLQSLETDPNTLVKLKQLYYENEKRICQHVETLTLAQLEMETQAHHETQATIRHGDSATDKIVRLTRPSHATLSLVAAIIYVFTQSHINENILLALLALPFTYAGLRQIGKGIDSLTLKNRLGPG